MHSSRFLHYLKHKSIMTRRSSSVGAASHVSRSLAMRFIILRCGTVVHQITQNLPILTSRSHRLKLYTIYKKKLNSSSWKYEGKTGREKTEYKISKWVILPGDSKVPQCQLYPFSILSCSLRIRWKTKKLPVIVLLN